MSLVAPDSDNDTWWMLYLKSIQRRPGWSAARLARESNGQLSLSTIKRMAQGSKRRVDVATVRLIATIVGDDPDDVVRRAAPSLVVEPEPAAAESHDPRLHGLDPNSTIVRHIMLLPIDETLRGHMLDHQRRKLAEREAQDLAELEFFQRQVIYLEGLRNQPREPEESADGVD